MEEHNGLAHDLGDARPLARGEVDLRQALQLDEDGFVITGDIGKRYCPQPGGATVRVGEGRWSRARLRLRLGECEFVGHRFPTKGGGSKTAGRHRVPSSSAAECIFLPGYGLPEEPDLHAIAPES